jgi:hypothetical protein
MTYANAPGSLGCDAIAIAMQMMWCAWHASAWHAQQSGVQPSAWPREQSSAAKRHSRCERASEPAACAWQEDVQLGCSCMQRHCSALLQCRHRGYPRPGLHAVSDMVTYAGVNAGQFGLVSLRMPLAPYCAHAIRIACTSISQELEAAPARTLCSL